LQKSTAIRIKPLPIAKRSIIEIDMASISPKTKSEQRIARGTTALLKAASVPALLSEAPLFQRKKPKPEATIPK
jgi:hypothetical protein